MIKNLQKLKQFLTSIIMDISLLADQNTWHGMEKKEIKKET